MKGAKTILASLRLARSSFLSQPSQVRALHYQVTYYSHLSPLFSSSSLQNHDFINTNHKFYFSSTPNSITEIISANEWSEDLEKELEKSHPSLTHETVVYVLKKLDSTPQKALEFFNWVSGKMGFKLNFTVYSLMLRTLCSKETIKEFWILAGKMSNEGCEVDLETYLTILSKLKCSKMISDANAWTQFYDKMSKDSAMNSTVERVADVVLKTDCNEEMMTKWLKITPSENLMLRIFRALRQAPLKALSFSRWAEKELGFKHNVVTYNSILRVLGQEESIEQFWAMVKELKSAGHHIDIDSYIKLSRSFQKSNMMKDVVELYELMMDSPYKPSVMDCSALLRKLSLEDTPDFELVFRVAKKYEATGHTLSKAVYDGIHRSLTTAGRFDEAETIVKTMRNAGYEPDNITYSQAVFGLCKARKFEDACKLLDEMEEQKCIPDMKTWTILIQGHCTTGEIDQAMKCFTKMLGKNIEADGDLLDVLVNGLCSKGKVDGAYTLITEMVDKTNLRPWQATYKNMIEKLLGERKLEEAMNLLRLMKKQNFPPCAELFVGYISKSGTLDDARELLKALTVKQYPTSTAYHHVLQSFLKEGRQPEARDLLFKCPHHIRNHPNIVKLFSTLPTSPRDKADSFVPHTSV